MECADASEYGLSAAAIIGIAGVAIAAAGTTVTVLQQQAAQKRNAAAQRESAEQAMEAARLEAAQEAQAAALSQQEAAREAEYQQVRERQQRERQRQIAGQIRVETAAAGLLLEGSPLFTLHENLRQTELGLLATRVESQAKQAALVREGQLGEFSSQMTLFGGQSRLRLGTMAAGITAQQGENAFTAGLLGVGGDVLKGAGSVYRTQQYSKDPYAGGLMR